MRCTSCKKIVKSNDLAPDNLYPFCIECDRELSTVNQSASQSWSASMLEVIDMAFADFCDFEDRYLFVPYDWKEDGF